RVHGFRAADEDGGMDGEPPPMYPLPRDALEVVDEAGDRGRLLQAERLPGELALVGEELSALRDPLGREGVEAGAVWRVEAETGVVRYRLRCVLRRVHEEGHAVGGAEERGGGLVQRRQPRRIGRDAVALVVRARG